MIKPTREQYDAMVAREADASRRDRLKKKPHLTAAQLKIKLDRLGFTQVGFAAKLDLGERTVRDWIAGKYPVPTYVASILALVEVAQLKAEDLWS